MEVAESRLCDALFEVADVQFQSRNFRLEHTPERERRLERRANHALVEGIVALILDEATDLARPRQFDIRRALEPVVQPPSVDLLHRKQGTLAHAKGRAGRCLHCLDGHVAQHFARRRIARDEMDVARTGMIERLVLDALGADAIEIDETHREVLGEAKAHHVDEFLLSQRRGFDGDDLNRASCPGPVQCPVLTRRRLREEIG